MPSSDLVPTASGTLEKTPLFHLLVYCLDHELSGTLVLQAPDNKRHAIYFHQGTPAKARTGDSFAHLGRVLFELGHLDQKALHTSLSHLSESNRGLHGELLVQEGVLDRSALIVGLREQVIRKVIHLFELPPASDFAFYTDKNLLERWGGPELTPVEPLALVWTGVQTYPNNAHINTLIDQLGSQALRPHVDGRFSRFQWGATEVQLLDLLKVKTLSFSELAQAGIASEHHVKLFVYALLITRHLDLGPGSKPPVGAGISQESELLEPRRTPVARVKLRSMIRSSPIVEVNPPHTSASSPPLPPTALPLNLEALREDIRTRVKGIDKEDYLTVLGLSKDALPDMVKAAYFALAKKWHPDRVPSELTAEREAAARVFARMSDAFQTLTDPEKRAAYINALQQPDSDEQGKVMRILEASTNYQKAEVLLKKGDLALAEKYVKKAIAADPEQVDYTALVAWLESQRSGADTETIERIVKVFDKILTQEPNHQKGLWYRGSLLKRLGKEDQAHKDFRRLAQLDSRHVDAAREVRLYAMRARGKGGKSESKPDSGRSTMLNKFFKKDLVGHHLAAA